MPPRSPDHSTSKLAAASPLGAGVQEALSPATKFYGKSFCSCDNDAATPVALTAFA